jgi:hypothetical protein
VEPTPRIEGHIIIYPKTESQRRGIERIVTSQIKVRKFDKSRITIVPGPINADGIVQFWSVPPGAENPKPVLGAETGEFLQKDESEYRQAPLPGLGTGADPKTRGTGIGNGSGDGIGRGSSDPTVNPAPRVTDPTIQTPNPPVPRSTGQ